MKNKKTVLSLMIALCLIFSLAGCSSNHDKNNLTDNLIDGWNNWIQSFSKLIVLIGENSNGNLELAVQDAEN